MGFNDTFGPHHGDEALKLIAASGRTELRESDLCGRMGGEEFGVNLGNTDMTAAKEVMERLRRNIETTPIPILGKPVSITLRAGLSAFDPADRTLDEIVRQMRACIAWLHGNIAEYGGDPNRIHVSGHSAGGHLTAMMAATDWAGFAPGLPADTVKSALPVSGVFDLEPIPGTSVQNDVRLDSAAVTRNSPALLPVPPGLAVAVAVGADESAECRTQSADYADSLRARGLEVACFEMPGQNHVNSMTNATQPGNRLGETRLRLMGLA